MTAPQKTCNMIQKIMADLASFKIWEHEDYMSRTREVGTLWIGGALSWLEQLCLKSFVDKGQKITLFSYEDIPNVPAGVICRDGREIIDTDDFIKYEQKNSFALFADWFRLHMIQKCPGMMSTAE